MSASAYYTYEDGTREQYVYTDRYVDAYVDQYGELKTDVFTIPDPSYGIASAEIDDSLIYDFNVSNVELRQFYFTAYTSTFSESSLQRINLKIDISELYEELTVITSFNDILLQDLDVLRRTEAPQIVSDTRSYLLGEYEVTTETFANTFAYEFVNTFDPTNTTQIVIFFTFEYRVHWTPYLSMTYYVLIISAISIPIIIGVLILKLKRRK